VKARQRPRLRISLLGGFRAERDGGSPIAFSRRKSQALLALLALRPNHTYSREELVATLWAESPDDQARHSLRQELHELRRTLAKTKIPALIVDGERVALDPGAVEIDSLSFERLAGEGTPSMLQRAAKLYAGDLLLGFSVAEEAFEEHLRAERERLRQRALGVLTRLLGQYVRAEQTESAIATALRLLAMDPTQEPVHRALMRLYTRAGQRAAALRQYQVCVEVLQRELGIEPDPETRQVYRELLATSRSEAPAPLTDGRRPTDGRRRPSRGPAPAPGPGQGGDPPLIGREEERARLIELVDAACQRRGHAVAIVGEAGVGKTRLAGEAVTAMLEREGRAIVGRAYETARVLTFGPWVDALRSGIEMDGAAVGALEPVWRLELARLLPELGGRTARTPPTDPTHLFDSVIKLIERLAARQPLLILLEDAQWADELTLRLAAHVARHLDRLPTLLVLTAREEEMFDAPLLAVALAELRQEARLVKITLSSLSRGDSRALVRALSRTEQDEKVLATLDEQAWRSSEGNPLIILEMVRELLAHPGGAKVPTRVTELVTARLERLSEQARRVVSLASVIRREFDFRLLQHAAALDDRRATEVVEELVRRRVLHAVGERLDFTHDLIREIAHAGLVPAQTGAIHRVIAASIEAVYAADLGPHAAALAAHYRTGEVWDKAARYLVEVGKALAGVAQTPAPELTLTDDQLTRIAYRDAASAFADALEATRHLPESRASLEQAVDIALELHTSYYALGELERSYQALREAQAPAATLGDPRRTALLALHTGQYLWVSGQAREALPLFEEVAAFARTTGDFGLLTSTSLYMATARFSLGDFERSRALYRTVVDALDAAKAQDRLGLHGVPLVFAHSGLAVVAAEQGRFAEARTHGEAAVRTAEAVGQAYSFVFASRVLSHACTVEGRLADAVTALQRCDPLFKDPSVSSLAPNVMASLGYARALSGRVRDGIELLEQALDTLDKHAQRVWFVVMLSELSEAWLLDGDVERARQCATRAVALARERGEGAFEVWALRALGAVAAAAREVDQAHEHYKTALALAESHEMRPLQARCHAGISALCAHTGDREGAQRHRAEALAIVRAIGMPPPYELGESA
jgi:DNA-binding SARP family transcriptional activator